MAAMTPTTTYIFPMLRIKSGSVCWAKSTGMLHSSQKKITVKYLIPSDLSAKSRFIFLLKQDYRTNLPQGSHRLLFAFKYLKSKSFIRYKRLTIQNPKRVQPIIAG